MYTSYSLIRSFLVPSGPCLLWPFTLGPNSAGCARRRSWRRRQVISCIVVTLNVVAGSDAICLLLQYSWIKKVLDALIVIRTWSLRLLDYTSGYYYFTFVSVG